ncbi:MAG: glycosyltransferase, partial [Lentisphaerae bacterium]|nr:glycosyltransferase [Lentisphaerota bacterium]
MKALIVLNSVALVLSVSGILLIFLFNPLFGCLVSLVARRKDVRDCAAPPLSVSLVTIVRNGESLVLDKIRNSFELDYPSDDRQVVVFSDGSTDATGEIARAVENPRFRFLSAPSHEGKNHAINEAVPACTGEILVFSDVDSVLDRNAIMALVRPFADPGVGGACGQRQVGEKHDALEAAQRDYFRFDSMLKSCESRTGSIASNDGKLFAIRRDLFKPLPDAVTDDLFLSMTVVRSGHRFVYEPGAVARVRTPSRSPGHEIERRRRIVSRSLHGIFLMAALLNPLRYGAYSLHLGALFANVSETPS